MSQTLSYLEIRTKDSQTRLRTCDIYMSKNDTFRHEVSGGERMLGSKNVISFFIFDVSLMTQDDSRRSDREECLRQNTYAQEINDIVSYTWET